jgi:hypothetical protein
MFRRASSNALERPFLAHGRADHDFAADLAGFLEDGQIGEHQDLISKAEEGLCADVLLLLLSQSSVP